MNKNKIPKTPKEFKKMVNKQEEMVKEKMKEYLMSDQVGILNGEPVPGTEVSQEANMNALQQRLLDCLNIGQTANTHSTTAKTVEELLREETYNDGDQSRISGAFEQQKLQSLWSSGRNWNPMNTSLFTKFSLACIQGDFVTIKQFLDQVKGNELERVKLLEKRETQMRFNSLLNLIAGARQFKENEEGYVKSLELLIQSGVNINAKDFAGFTAIMHCCTCYGNEKTLKLAGMLLEAGARINEQNRIGCNALFEPTMSANYFVCKWLVEHGADPTCKEYTSGLTPITLSRAYSSITSLFSTKTTKAKRTESLVCAKCGKASSKHCAKCLKAFYCSRDCQKADWSKHKKICASNLFNEGAEEPSQASKATGSDNVIVTLTEKEWTDGPIAFTTYNLKSQNTYSNIHGNQESAKSKKKREKKANASDSEDSDDKVRSESKRFPIKIQVPLDDKRTFPMMCYNNDRSVNFMYMPTYEKYNEIYDKVINDGIGGVKAFFGAWINDATNELNIDVSHVLPPKSW